MTNIPTPFPLYAILTPPSCGIVRWHLITQGYAKALQSVNREYVTAIVAVNIAE